MGDFYDLESLRQLRALKSPIVTFLLVVLLKLNITLAARSLAGLPQYDIVAT